MVQSDREPFQGEVVVKDGRIAAVMEGQSETRAKRILEVNGSWVLPGVVDAHVHCLSDPHEGITNCTRAAAAGGVTTIIEMPFDAGGPVNNLDTFLRKKERVQQEALVDVALLATIRKRGGLDQIEGLAKAGACDFKLSLLRPTGALSTDSGDELLEAFRLVAGRAYRRSPRREHGHLMDWSLDPRAAGPWLIAEPPAGERRKRHQGLS